MEPEDFLAGHPKARATFDKVRPILEGLGPVEVRTSKSQLHDADEVDDEVVGWLREAAERAT
jgi:hypothetical protein